MSDDRAYCYPPTFDVLINKEGLRDAADLETFERGATTIRMESCPRDLPISYEGYKAIHEHVFQDVYEWAGEVRTIPIEKGGTRFELPERIDGEMQRSFKELGAENNLQDLPIDKFAERAASYLDDINITHPFREGNGRTQRLFLRNLAEQGGYDLRISGIDRDDWMNASIESMHRSNHTPMIELITSAIEGRSQSAYLEDYREASQENDLGRDRDHGHDDDDDHGL